MTFVSEHGALELWESGAGLSPLARAHELMRVLHPASDAGSLLAMPVGTRNARALTAFASTFGDVLPCEVECPECGARLEFQVGIADLLAAHRERPGEPSVEHGGIAYRARVPTDADLCTALEEGSGADGVMARCALTPAFDEWPAMAVAAVEERMAQSDPLAVIRVALACPDCGHSWDGPLDAVEIVYARMAERARRLLLEVHRLAQAYGWSESEILALNPTRRRQYLALVSN